MRQISQFALSLLGFFWLFSFLLSFSLMWSPAPSPVVSPFWAIPKLLCKKLLCAGSLLMPSLRGIDIHFACSPLDMGLGSLGSFGWVTKTSINIFCLFRFQITGGHFYL